MRIVSLLPSATEMLYALDVEPVGVSCECDYPPETRELPTVNRSRVDPAAPSADIDDQVQDAQDGDGVYEIDRETLAALDPDVIVSQGICDVCAVDDTAIRRAVDELELDARVLTSDPHSLHDVFDDIERLGRELDCPERAHSVRAEMESRVERIVDRTPDDGPRVAVLDWLDPVMVAGHWVPGMIERLGATYGMAKPGVASRPREWQSIRDYDPEALLVAPCGFGLDQIRENATDLTTRDGWEDLTAVQDGRVYAVDGNHYVNRPGPRLVETLAVFASALYPGTVEAPDGALEPFPLADGQAAQPLD